MNKSIIPNLVELDRMVKETKIYANLIRLIIPCRFVGGAVQTAPSSSSSMRSMPLAQSDKIRTQSYNNADSSLSASATTTTKQSNSILSNDDGRRQSEVKIITNSCFFCAFDYVIWLSLSTKK